MTNLQRWTTKDIDKIFDAANRYSVGFDDLFDRFHAYGSGTIAGQYPPYNIVKESTEKWRIEIALAGWNKDDIEVSTQQNVLLVKSKVQESKPDAEEYAHKGVASRTFSRGFNLSDDVEIGSIKHENGLLSIELNKIIPEHQKHKVYEIA
tara:strand:+ start:533 stop:982 length:450 start_codon:yes stop_codon:yes gene_type:complete